MGASPQEIVYGSRHADDSGWRWLVKLDAARPTYDRRVWIGSGGGYRTDPSDFSVLADAAELRAMAEALRAIADILDAAPTLPEGRVQEPRS